MKLSIFCVAYNHAPFIAQALDSFLMQETDFRYEIVIGEDCSTDHTREILLAYQKKHPDKIRLLLHEKNIGMVQNFVQTLRACTGEYIAICEGDDYWTDTKKLQKQVSILDKNPGISLCSHGAVRLENGTMEAVPNAVDGVSVYHIEDILKHDWFMMTASFVLRRTCVEEIPPWYFECSQADLGLVLLAGMQGAYYYIDTPMSVYRITSTGAMARMTVEDTKKLVYLADAFNEYSGRKYTESIRQFRSKYTERISWFYFNESLKTSMFKSGFWNNLKEGYRYSHSLKDVLKTMLTKILS